MASNGASPSNSQGASKKPSLTSRIRNSIFHEHIHDTPSPSSPSADKEIHHHPSNHPFLNIPPPPPPKHDQTTLPTTKFKTKPHHLLFESRDEYRLRKARLELASKLAVVRPQSPLLDRVHPKTGTVMAEANFAGTPHESNTKNRRVKKKKGFVDAVDITEVIEWEEAEQARIKDFEECEKSRRLVMDSRRGNAEEGLVVKGLMACGGCLTD